MAARPRPLSSLRVPARPPFIAIHRYPVRNSPALLSVPAACKAHNNNQNSKNRDHQSRFGFPCLAHRSPGWAAGKASSPGRRREVQIASGLAEIQTILTEFANGLIVNALAGGKPAELKIEWIFLGICRALCYRLNNCLQQRSCEQPTNLKP